MSTVQHPHPRLWNRFGLRGLRAGWAAPERRTTPTLAGTRIAERVSLRQAIALCPTCTRKFDARRNDYTPAKRWGYATGKCDGCQEHSTADQVVHIHNSSVKHTVGKHAGIAYTP